MRAVSSALARICDGRSARSTGNSAANRGGTGDGANTLLMIFGASARPKSGEIVYRITSPSTGIAGGDNSVRGYRYQTLGERDAANNVIGGEVLRIVSLEFDQKVSDKFGGLGVAVFGDAGNATRSFKEKMKKGAGFGIRWKSPIGMVRADMAWAEGCGLVFGSANGCTFSPIRLVR